MDEIAELLHTRMNSRISIDRWKQLAAYPWWEDKPDLGRVAVVDGRIVGYLGAIYAQRPVNGRLETFVNLNSWYMERSARQQGKGLSPGLGLRMLVDLLRDPSRHYFVNTSSGMTVALVKRSGLKVVDTHKYVWQRDSEAGRPALSLLSDPSDVLEFVTPAQRQAILDHQAMPVESYVVRGPDGQSLFMAVSRAIKNGGETWFDVLHVSDPALIGPWGQQIANLLLDGPDMYLSCDRRLCSRPAPGAQCVELDVPRFYKTASLDPHWFDHLYSEIPVLRLKLS
jgi:hypothetical protein